MTSIDLCHDFSLLFLLFSERLTANRSIKYAEKYKRKQLGASHELATHIAESHVSKEHHDLYFYIRENLKYCFVLCVPQFKKGTICYT
jgi:hypothetical protein